MAAILKKRPSYDSDATTDEELDPDEDFSTDFIDYAPEDDNSAELCQFYHDAQMDPNHNGVCHAIALTRAARKRPTRLGLNLLQRNADTFQQQFEDRYFTALTKSDNVDARRHLVTYGDLIGAHGDPNDDRGWLSYWPANAGSRQPTQDGHSVYYNHGQVYDPNFNHPLRMDDVIDTFQHVPNLEDFTFDSIRREFPRIPSYRTKSARTRYEKKQPWRNGHIQPFSFVEGLGVKKRRSRRHHK